MNEIITGGLDRNLLVWSQKDCTWNNQLVNLINERAILRLDWTRDGKKFLAATGSKKLCIGYFLNSEWTCSYIKDHKSSVVSGSFSENGLLVASGSTQMKVVISACGIEEIGDKTSNKFGAKLWEIKLDVWINDVKFEKNEVYFVTHDGQVGLIQEGEVVKSWELDSQPGNKFVRNSETLLFHTFDRQILAIENQNIKEVSTKENLIKPFEQKKSMILTRKSQLEINFQGSNLKLNKENKHRHSALIVEGFFVEGKLVTYDVSGMFKVWRME